VRNEGTHGPTNTSDAQTEANRQLMIETFEAWRDGAEPFPDTWATDMVWRFEGPLDCLKGVRQQARVPRRVRQTLRRALPNLSAVSPDEHPLSACRREHGDRPVGRARHRQTGSPTRTPMPSYAVRDGKIGDVTALTDSISLNELLERVQPAAHVDS
jgi:ketosteroid isomerase-like protein